MATFRSKKELTRALQQGSKLQSNMFLQRKTVGVKYDDALDTLDGDGDKRVQPLLDCIHLYHKGYDQEGYTKTKNKEQKYIIPVG